MFIGKNIKSLRKEKKLTQKEFAEVLGMKSNTIIGKYEDGKVIPPVEVLEKIAEQFGVDLQDLMFTNLETGEKVENKKVDQDRMQRLIAKELDRLEALERKIKANGQIMDTIRKIDPDLAKAIEES